MEISMEKATNEELREALEKFQLGKLIELNKALEADMQVLAQQAMALQFASNKFEDSIKAIDATCRPENRNAELLVPLTSSVYVPGRILDVDCVMIGLGGGYQVECSSKFAKDYCERRSTFATQNQRKAQAGFFERRRLQREVAGVLQEKVAAARQNTGAVEEAMQHLRLHGTSSGASPQGS